jgi:hypothetical protein
MVFIKLLGILDILAAIFFYLFATFNIIPSTIISFFAIYLILKGISFAIMANAVSVVDILIGIIIFLSLSIIIPNFIVAIVTLFLLQKGIFSLLG